MLSWGYDHICTGHALCADRELAVDVDVGEYYFCVRTGDVNIPHPAIRNRYAVRGIPKDLA